MFLPYLLLLVVVAVATVDGAVAFQLSFDGASHATDQFVDNQNVDEFVVFLGEEGMAESPGNSIAVFVGHIRQRFVGIGSHQ